jgi:hypothetical protein
VFHPVMAIDKFDFDERQWRGLLLVSRRKDEHLHDNTSAVIGSK